MTALTIGVKICGLSTPDTLDAAIDAGADFIGLVFFPRSPRHVNFEQAAALASHARGRAQIVALTVNADDATLDALMRFVSPDYIQLHGEETPNRTAIVARLTGRPVIKAIAVASTANALRALDYKAAANLILFDAKPPTTADALPGGNGLSFDWHLLDGVKDNIAYMLSGGLTPDNVAQAICETGATMVDVSSGVECAPGIKDANLIRRFIAAAKGHA
jgi:phosphoribosylanthranilate isomerase